MLMLLVGSFPVMDERKETLRDKESPPQISYSIFGLSAEEFLFLLSQHALNLSSSGPFLKGKKATHMVPKNIDF